MQTDWVYVADKEPEPTQVFSDDIDPAIKAFFKQKSEIQRKMNTIDPRDVYLLERLKLREKSSLRVDRSFTTPDR